MEALLWITLFIVVLIITYKCISAYITENYVPVQEWAQRTNDLRDACTLTTDLGIKLKDAERSVKVEQARLKVAMVVGDMLRNILEKDAKLIMALKSECMFPDVVLNDVLIESAEDFLSAKGIECLRYLQNLPTPYTLATIAEMTKSAITKIPGIGRATAKEVIEFAQGCVDLRQPEVPQEETEDDGAAHPESGEEEHSA